MALPVDYVMIDGSGRLQGNSHLVPAQADVKICLINVVDNVLMVGKRGG